MRKALITNVNVNSSGFKSIKKPVFILTIVGRQDEAKIREILKRKQNVGHAGIN